MVPPQHLRLVSLCTCQPWRRTCCRCASFRGRQTCCRNCREPPAASSLTDVAMRGLRRFVLLMAQFTVRTRHGTPLRRALRVCSSTCTLVSVLRETLSIVRVCIHHALLRGTVVLNLHYSGIALNSAGPALLRALSVSGDFTCTIPGTCTIQPAL